MIIVKLLLYPGSYNLLKKRPHIGSPDCRDLKCRTVEQWTAGSRQGLYNIL